MSDVPTPEELDALDRMLAGGGNPSSVTPDLAALAQTASLLRELAADETGLDQVGAWNRIQAGIAAQPRTTARGWRPALALPALPRLRFPTGMPRALASATVAVAIAMLAIAGALLVDGDSAEAQFLAAVEQLQIESDTAFADEALTPDETAALERRVAAVITALEREREALADLPVERLDSALATLAAVQLRIERAATAQRSTHAPERPERPNADPATDPSTPTTPDVRLDVAADRIADVTIAVRTALDEATSRREAQQPPQDNDTTNGSADGTRCPSDGTTDAAQRRQAEAEQRREAEQREAEREAERRRQEERERQRQTEQDRRGVEIDGTIPLLPLPERDSTNRDDSDRNADDRDGTSETERDGTHTDTQRDNLLPPIRTPDRPTNDTQRRQHPNRPRHPDDNALAGIRLIPGTDANTVDGTRE